MAWVAAARFFIAVAARSMTPPVSTARPMVICRSSQAAPIRRLASSAWEMGSPSSAALVANCSMTKLAKPVFFSISVKAEAVLPREAAIFLFATSILATMPSSSSSSCSILLMPDITRSISWEASRPRAVDTDITFLITVPIF